MNIDPLAATPDLNSPAYMVAIILGKIPYPELLAPAIGERFTKALEPLASKATSSGTVMVRQSFTPGAKVKFPKSVPWNSKQQFALHERFKTDTSEIKNLSGFQYFAMFPDQAKWNSTTFPELFFRMDKHFIPRDYERFTIGCVLAIQTQILAGDIHVFDQTLTSFSQLFQATLVLKKVRHFQDKLLLGSYANSLIDLFPCTVVDNAESLSLKPKMADWDVILRQSVSS